MSTMFFRVEWYIPNQVIYAVGWGEGSKEGLFEYLTYQSEMMDSADKDVALIHIIGDFTRMTRQTTMIESAQVIKSMKPNPRMGWSIIVGETSPINKFATDIARQMLKMRQRNFDTVEEALAFLRDVDSTLDWSKADEAALVRARPSAEELAASSIKP